MLLKLEGFKYATSLDLNMGYYHIELDLSSQSLCTIVLPFGKYEYTRLPMGLSNSPDIFQERMSELLSGFKYVRTYIDDLLCLTKGSWEDYLNKLEQVLCKLQEASLKVNARKSFFGKDSLEYLGYWVTRDGISPLESKVSAIRRITMPKSKCDLHKFIGIVNYYCAMWIRRSATLAPLSKFMSKESKWKWTDVEQYAFNTMKWIVGKETLLAYPDFNDTFEIHTDVSHTQLGAVISQRGCPITFYSHKLNPAQMRYTTIERELLAIVETLKEFHNILLGQKSKIYTDHKNLMYKTFNTEHIMRWWLVIEEFSPELLYIKGEQNIVADALSCLDIDKNTTDCLEAYATAEYYGSSTEELPDTSFPLQYKDIQQAQQQDEWLLNKLQSDKTYSTKIYRWGGKSHMLIMHDGKIAIPKKYKKRIMNWYHLQLCHPSKNRAEQTIRQHFT